MVLTFIELEGAIPVDHIDRPHRLVVADLEQPELDLARLARPRPGAPDDDGGVARRAMRPEYMETSLVREVVRVVMSQKHERIEPLEHTRLARGVGSHQH